MVPRKAIDKIHEVLDHIEAAHKLAEQIDAPTAELLHLARVQLENVLAQKLTHNARAEWRDRPMAG